MMKIKIHNTLSGRKEEFTPLDGKTVKLYVCGITPYDSVHLGHARCYVVFDVIKRFFQKSGYNVRHIQNFTDIDDKIIKRSAEIGIPPLELAQKYIDEYFLMIRKLNIIDADHYPLVTQTINEIISLVSKLIERGYAYVSEGDVYFSVRKFQSYGKLSKRSIDDLLVGARIEPSEKKSDPLDFALWKKSKEGEPSWESPWGEGRPGWHIECSAMAQKFLGETIDIHGGGQDLIFPHHENEIAQSECATGKPFARYFIHNGFVTINSEKMSKSLGNFFTLKEIFEKYDPMVVRYFLISQHYRSPLDFSNEGLEQAKHTLERIQNALFDAHMLAQQLPEDGIKNGIDEIINEIKHQFDEALADDFNTAQALAQLHTAVNLIFTMVRDKPKGLGKISVLKIIDVINNMLDTLGLNFEISKAIPPDVIKLSDEREKARKARNYQLADDIRNKIKALGYQVEDTPKGPKIKKL